MVTRISLIVYSYLQKYKYIFKHKHLYRRSLSKMFILIFIDTRKHRTRASTFVKSESVYQFVIFFNIYILMQLTVPLVHNISMQVPLVNIRTNFCERVYMFQSKQINCKQVHHSLSQRNKLASSSNCELPSSATNFSSRYRGRYHELNIIE